jgi:hypothetical protein
VLTRHIDMSNRWEILWLRLWQCDNHSTGFAFVTAAIADRLVVVRCSGGIGKCLKYKQLPGVAKRCTTRKKRCKLINSDYLWFGTFSHVPIFGTPYSFTQFPSLSIRTITYQSRWMLMTSTSTVRFTGYLTADGNVW